MVTLGPSAWQRMAACPAGPLCTEPTKSVGLGNCSADWKRRCRKSWVSLSPPQPLPAKIAPGAAPGEVVLPRRVVSAKGE